MSFSSHFQLSGSSQSVVARRAATMIPSAVKVMIALCITLFTTGIVLSIFAYYHMEQKIMVFACFFLFPPTLFLKTTPAANSLAQSIVKMLLGLVIWHGSLVVAFAAHCLTSDGLLDEEAAHTWMEMARAAAALFLLPLFFVFIRPPPGDDAPAVVEEGEEDFFRVPNDGPVTLALPGGAVVGVAFLPGSILEALLGGKQGRAIVMAYCSFVVLVTCTLAAAAVAASFELIAAETTLAYLYVAASTSVLHSMPRLFFAAANTRITARLLFWLAIPLSLAATPWLLSYEDGMRSIEDTFWMIRSLAWFVIMPLSMRM